MPKRKARADDDDDASEAGGGPLDLDQPASGVARDILASLGPDATEQSKPTKTLQQAMKLVLKELSNRSAKARRAAVASGESSAIVFAGSSVPAAVFQHLVEYAAPRKDYGNLMATQRSVLAAIGSTPRLWKRACDASPHSEIVASSKKLSMKALLARLKKPRYADVDVLCLSSGIKVGKTGLASLSKVLPSLAALDFGFSGSNLHPKDSELLDAARELSALTSLRCDMWNVTQFGVAAFAQEMGARLLDLRVADDTITKHYVGDYALGVIADNCPKLQRLSLVGDAYGSYYEGFRDSSTANGISRLLDGVGASIQRLDIFKKNNVDRAVAGADVAQRLETGRLPVLKRLTWVHATPRPGQPAATDDGWNGSPVKARLEAALSAAGVEFVEKVEACRFRDYSPFAMED